MELSTDLSLQENPIKEIEYLSQKRMIVTLCVKLDILERLRYCFQAEILLLSTPKDV